MINKIKQICKRRTDNKVFDDIMYWIEAYNPPLKILALAEEVSCDVIERLKQNEKYDIQCTYDDKDILTIEIKCRASEKVIIL